MSFRDDLKKFQRTVEVRERDIFVGVVSEAQRSITVGSEVTGAPGQPVDTGTLRNSWTPIWENARRVLIATNLDYARPIEDGTSHGRAMTLRSKVGGFHSVKITVAKMHDIVAHVRREVVGYA